jgi:phage gp29-like protein
MAPVTQEIAYPDNRIMYSGYRSDPYTDALTPTDSVLRARGDLTLSIYKELLRDDQVRSVWQQRRLKVTKAEVEIEPGADDPLSEAAAEAFKEELQGLAWDDITDKMLYAQFYGWGVAEVMWRPDGSRVRFANILVRDRARFRFSMSNTLYLNRLTGIEAMPERKFWTISTGSDNHDEPYGLGLAHSLYWPVFFKRNDIKFWLVFLEKFGQPTAVAKLPAGQIEDPAQRAKAVAMLKSIATDSGVVVPDNIVVELLEAARSGAGDYESMVKAMDSAISKVILSQTMTSDNGASLAQAKVHEGVADAVVKADADLVSETFMRGPLQWWVDWNFPGAKVPRIRRMVEPPEDMNARADRDKKISELGYEPTEEYIRETYGDGWQKKKQPEALPGALPGAPLDQQQFAEGELAAIAALKAARRGDQDAMVDAAVRFAEQYETIMGKRVAALINAAEDADDYDTFGRRLNEILAEVPDAATVDKLTRASVFSRLMGAFRTQRKDSPQPSIAKLAASFAEQSKANLEAIKEIATREQPAPVIHITMPERAVNVQPPAVTVKYAEQPAPVVNIQPPVVNVAAPNVQVDVQPAQVTLEANMPAPEVTVNIPPRQVVAEIERNRSGEMTRVVQTESDL